MPLGQRLAQLGKQWIDGRLAACHVKQPGKIGGIKRGLPLLRRCMHLQFIAEGVCSEKAVSAPVIAGVEQMPVRFDIVLH
jgi:hypothetical protein